MDETGKTVLVMIKQHCVLVQDLGAAQTELSQETINHARVASLLQKFNADLVEHLELENSYFYPRLLNLMKQRQVPDDQVKKFCAEMNGIGVAVVAFLKEFSDTEKVEKHIEKLKNDLPGLAVTLKKRIEAEEAGVYSFWNLLSGEK